MVPGCMRTDGHEKIGQEDLIGKRTIGTNNILMEGIVEVNIEHISHYHPAEHHECRPTVFSMHDNIFGKVGNQISAACREKF